MGVILGVDIGTSTTKIAAIDEKGILKVTEQITASDQITALFGSIGRVLYKEKLSLDDIDKIVLTGMGASFIDGNLYDKPTFKVTEFEALGTGGLFLSDNEEAIVVNLGTGTTLVKASADEIIHIGGSAVGGGTLTGLSSRMFGVTDVKVISAMASKGNLQNVDIGMSEISREKVPSLPDYATASNFGKMKSTATNNDVALGLLNMIYQTAGTLAVFASRNLGINDVVMTGSLATLKNARVLLGHVAELYGVNFIIPKKAAFATAAGAAKLGMSLKE